MSSIPKPSKIARPMTTSQVSEKGGGSPSDSNNSLNLKVGDKVLVRGSTPGVIAFLGETKFAPDLWAGVILDKPEGKNDGSVAGVSYFKCKAMYGIFSRPSRLTLRDALENARSGPIPNINFQGLGSKERVSSPGLSSLFAKGISPSKTSISSRVLPVDECVRTPSPTESTTSMSSVKVSDTPQIGDRVIVSSSTSGSKVGTLRYLGKADFAQGEWAGVELDLPNGKNDGSVQGTVYFECKANYGVFVLSSKVSKSPRNFMPFRQLSNLSSASITTPARKISRQKSDVSTTSISSTSASKRRSVSSINAPEMLKLSLKEKETEIDKLTKEMELERAQFSKAANQTDLVELKLRDMEKNFGVYKLETINSIQKKDIRLSELSDKLSEEKQKYEDLQFQFEELQLSKGSSDQKDVSLLKLQLDKSNELIIELQVENDDIKKKSSESAIIIKDMEERYSDLSFESEEKTVALNLEIERLKKDMEKYMISLEREKERSVSVQDKIKMEEESVTRKIETLEEYISKKDEEILELNMRIESFEKSEESTSQKYDKSLSDLKNSEFRNQELSTKLSQIEVEIQCQLGEVDRLNNKIFTLNESLENKDSEFKTLKKSLSTTEQSLKASKEEYEKVIQKLSLSDSSSSKELDRLTEENKVLQQKIESLSSASRKEIEEMKEKLGKTNLEFTENSNKFDNILSINGNLEKEIEALRSGSTINNEEVKRLSGCLSLKDSEMTALRADLSNLVSQLNTLKDVITQNEFEAKEKETFLVKEHEKEVCKLMDALKKSEGIIKKVEKAKSDVVEILNGKIKSIRNQSTDQESELKRELLEALAENTRLTQDLEASRIQIQLTGSETSQELSSLKEAIETNIKNTRFKEQELETIQKELSESNHKLERASEESNREKEHRIELQEKLESLKETHDEEMGELVDVVNDLKEKEDDLKAAMFELEAKTDALVKLERESTRKEKYLQEEVQRLKVANLEEVQILNTSLDETKGQMTYLKESSASSKVDYDLRKEKLDKEKQHLEEEHAKEVDKKEDLIQKLKSELSNKEVELEVANDELRAKTEELEQVSLDLEVKEASFSNRVQINDESHKSEIEVLVSKVEDAKVEVIDLNEKLAKTRAKHDSKLDELKLEKKVEVNHLQDLLSERDRDIVDLKAKITELENQVKDVMRTSEDEVKLLNAKISKLSSEFEDIRSVKKEVESRVKTVEAQRDEIHLRNEELELKIVEKESTVKEVTSQAQTVKLSFEKTKKELAEYVEKSIEITSGKDELLGALKMERQRVDELQVALGEAESDREGLSKQLEGHKTARKKLRSLEERERELNATIEEMRKEQSLMQKEFSAERNELNEVVQNSQVLLRQKIEEFKAQKLEFDNLQSENVQVNSYKRKMLILEQEKRELENKMNSSNNNNSKESKHSSKNNGVDPEEEEEDLESLRGQVDFLNSVIVDMQRKNDKYKMKLDLYESGKIVGGEDPNDEHSQLNLLLNGIDSHQVPPRLFCDICDQFDLHDTEDCPTQAMMVVDEGSHTRNAASRSSNRPYCDSCEVFGHDTENCNEEETF